MDIHFLLRIKFVNWETLKNLKWANLKMLLNMEMKKLFKTSNHVYKTNKLHNN